MNINDFGKDHWSVFAFCEVRCVDYYGGGIPTKYLRIKNEAIHSGWKPEWGTKLAGYFLENDEVDLSRRLDDHDDLDCIEDLENAGLLKNRGSGINPHISLTDKGFEISGKLRAHKARGGQYSSFKGDGGE